MTIAARLGPLLPDWLLVRVLARVYGRFEPELRHLDEMWSGGGTALDIGGWYGPWSHRLARRAEQVVAFEPSALARVLARTLPSNATVIPAAASDHGGEAELWLARPGGAEGVSSLHHRDVHALSSRVRLVTVDSLGLTDITFVKVDVDGHEVPALRGAERTIRRDLPAVIVEVETRIQPPGDVIDLLASWGYQGWVLPERHWVPVAAFDLVGHQERTRHVAERGLLRRLLWPYPRYVNSVLFLPAGVAPGRRKAGRLLRARPPGSASDRGSDCASAPVTTFSVRDRGLGGQRLG